MKSKITIKEKLFSLPKERLLDIALHFIKQSNIDTDQPVVEGACEDAHSGQCGICIGDTFVPCGSGG